MGIISASMVSQFQEFGYSNDMIKISLYVILGLGVLIALLGFLGCCGACCENQCLLGTVSLPASQIPFKEKFIVKYEALVGSKRHILFLLFLLSS